MERRTSFTGKRFSSSIDKTFYRLIRFPFVAISIALTIKKEVVIGVIYNPVLDLLYSAVRGKGAFKNGRPIKCSGQTGRARRGKLEKNFDRRSFQSWPCPKSQASTGRAASRTLSTRSVRIYASSSRKSTGKRTSPPSPSSPHPFVQHSSGRKCGDESLSRCRRKLRRLFRIRNSHLGLR